MLKVKFNLAFYEDVQKLIKENPRLEKKVNELIESARDTPFQGLGKPEPLKGNFQGAWSRRISKKHLLVYRVEDDILVVAQAYGHYEDK